MNRPATASAQISPKTKLPLEVSTSSGALPFFPRDVPLDLYIFLATSNPPTHKEIKSQYSSLVEHGPNQEDEITSLIDFQSPVYSPFWVNNDQKIMTLKNQEGLPAVKFTDIILGDEKSIDRKLDLEFKVPEQVQNHNASIWAEYYLTLKGNYPDPKGEHPERVFHTRKRECSKNLSCHCRCVSYSNFHLSSSSYIQFYQDFIRKRKLEWKEISSVQTQLPNLKKPNLKRMLHFQLFLIGIETVQCR